jgi:hypothetical protein
MVGQSKGKIVSVDAMEAYEGVEEELVTGWR